MNDHIRQYIFLDIDGVLNDHAFNPATKSGTLLPRCVERFNRILRATKGCIVVTSAWRYMVHGDAMSLRGFEYLLRTHGVECEDRVVGMTQMDEHCRCGHDNLPGGGPCEDCGAKPLRAQQVSAWLENRPHGPYVVLDDDDFGFTLLRHPFVQTDGKAGLTEPDANRAIELLAMATAGSEVA